MIHVNPFELRKNQLPPVYEHVLSHSSGSAFSSRGSIFSLLHHLGFNLYKYSCNLGVICLSSADENVILYGQSSFLPKVQMSGYGSLGGGVFPRPSTAGRRRDEVRLDIQWGAYTAEQTLCLHSAGHRQFNSKLRAVWAGCQLPWDSEWQKFPQAFGQGPKNQLSNVVTQKNHKFPTVSKVESPETK